MGGVCLATGWGELSAVLASVGHSDDAGPSFLSVDSPGEIVPRKSPPSYVIEEGIEAKGSISSPPSRW